MNSKKMKNLTTILYVLIASIATLLLSNVIFGWYVGTSNDAIAESNEIKTVTSGYGGRYTTETDYISHSSDVFQDDENVITTAYVKPGDVLFFTFIMEFDSSDGESLKGATYNINIVLNAGYQSNDNYYGVTTGNYNSFLYNIGIPNNTTTMAIAKKEEYSTSYKYVVTSSPTITSTGVTHFSSTTTSSGTVGCSFNVTFPETMIYPTSVDDKIYFMLYLPIFYQDTNELQNNEMNCYLKFASVIYEKVTS